MTRQHLSESCAAAPALRSELKSPRVMRRPGPVLVVLDQTQIRAELANLQAQAQKDKLNWERYEFLVPQGAAQPKSAMNSRPSTWLPGKR
jgi:hypothetical protein